MNNNLTVKVTYRNARMEPVDTRLYSLEDYTAMLKNDIQKVITDIEDAFYIASGNKHKDEWPDEVWGSFIRIKHKLLDKAGDIGRIPDNIVYTGGNKTCP